MKIIKNIRSAARSAVYPLQKHCDIEISGNRELIMTCCESIAAYSVTDVVLCSKKGSIHIIGCDLELVLLSEKTIAVRGTISKVCFGEGL